MKIYWKYFYTLALHKWFVFLECSKTGIPISGIVHDLSKYLPSEFFPYARYWGNRAEDRTALDIINYEKALILHKARKINRHHWEWWVDKDRSDPKGLAMDKRSRTEMLCDWRGASRAYNGADYTLNYYLTNRDRIVLHPDTRLWLEQELGIIEKNNQQKRYFLPVVFDRLGFLSRHEKYPRV